MVALSDFRAPLDQLHLLVGIHLDILGEWVYLRYLECLPSQATVESISYRARWIC